MGIRENKVETYLDAEVKKRGGITRKWISPGRDGVPDRIIRLPGWPLGKCWLVEVKTVDGELEPSQRLEQRRLHKAGFIVFTVYGEKDIDQILEAAT